jgi:hypothetical protein
MAEVLGSERRYYLFDSFEARIVHARFSEPTEHHPE